MIWLSLIYPTIATTLLLGISSLRKKIVWWEILLMYLPPIITTFVFSIQTYCDDVERLSGYAQKVEYHEDWDETVPCSHPIYRTVRSGNTTTTVFAGWAHPYDVAYHPKKWILKTSLNDISIDANDFNYLAQKWTNGVTQFVNMHRHYHSINGNVYTSSWDGSWDKMEPVSIENTYENRPQYSDSVFKFRKIDPKETPVYEYSPLSKWRSNNIVGPHTTQDALDELARLNAKHGTQRQCQIWICTWRNQPQSVGFDQQQFWKNGNKNEIVICLSTDDEDHVQWAHVFSWMDNQELSYDIRSRVLEQGKLNIMDLLKTTDTLITEKWVRKHFGKNNHDEGFTYISVPVPTWAIIVSHMLSLLITCGTSYWIVSNDIEED